MRRATGAQSFRVRFVASLVLVALLPVGAAAWALGRSDAGSELERADLRLATALQVSTGALADAVARADGKAARIAASPKLQRALVRDDRSRLWAVAGPNDVLVTVKGRVLAGRPRLPALTRSVAVVRGGFSIGRVIAQIPLDDALAGDLERTAGVDDVRIAVLRRGRVLGGAALTGGRLPLAAGRAGDVEIDGDEYRALVGPPVAGMQAIRLAALVGRGGVE